MILPWKRVNLIMFYIKFTQYRLYKWVSDMICKEEVAADFFFLNQMVFTRIRNGQTIITQYKIYTFYVTSAKNDGSKTNKLPCSQATNG